jgi:hypothetical protein
MNITHYDSRVLVDLFQQQKIATLPQLKQALGTSVTMTVYRKLSSLRSLTSYSHRGAYYTLENFAQFDERGLWTCQGVHFSRQGTLLDTVVSCVENSPAGYFAAELQAVLGVEVKDALRQLTQARRIHRQEVDGRYFYEAAERSRRQEQRASRRAGNQNADELAAATLLFYSMLDEQQRRLFAGLESLVQGHGGDRGMADLLGLDVDTVARGRRELLSGQVLRQRVRRAGAGRARVEKKLPAS